MDMDDPHDEHFRQLRAQLRDVASPRQMEYHYDRDERAWLDRAVAKDEESLAVAKAMDVERASTPIMSNYSTPRSAATIQPVQSPWVTTPVASTVVARSAPSSASSHHHYHRYAQALHAYVATKRRLMERRRLQSTSGDEEEERRAEIEWLGALHRASWQRADETQSMLAGMEGNFWLLLLELRRLGRAALIWEDDTASAAQHASALAAFGQALAERVEATPAQLLAETAHASFSSAPLIWKRRCTIVDWLEKCLAKNVTAGATRPRRGSVLPDSQLLAKQGLLETNQDAAILEASLSLLLAGRLDAATTLARESGVAWRAAAWSGGAPHGYTDNDENTPSRCSTGNPHRALWRRVMWLQADRLWKDPASNDHEAAMAALLSHHVSAAIDNVALRTWEKSLYAILSAMVGRFQDEILHRHNNRRRMLRPSFPGTEYPQKEREHLEATSSIATMNEATALQVIKSSPFEAVQREDWVTRATASFLTGRAAVVAFVDQVVADLTRAASSSPPEVLRFVTHLVLYLDSLAESPTPMMIGDTRAWKNAVLELYLDYLGQREDLWHTLVLYASFLDQELMVQRLPTLLAAIESRDERVTIVDQLAELLPETGLDLVILRRVVAGVLAETDSVMVPETPTRLDVRKMKSIQWLCLCDEHLTEALLSANALLRQFLLADKLASAFLFLDDEMPDRLALCAIDEMDLEEEETANVALLENARSEHMAYQSYLDAMKQVNNWRQVVSETSAETIVMDDRMDSLQFTVIEAAAAARQERHNFVMEKRQQNLVVAEAADKAQQCLKKVLTHEGGWLLTEDEETTGDENEGQLRRGELEALRVKLLPEVVFLCLEVCCETAAWMSTSLDDSAETLGCNSSKAALSEVDETERAEASPFSPRYWTKRALILAELMASGEYNIQSAFHVDSLKEFSAKLADAAQADYIYVNQLAK